MIKKLFNIFRSIRAWNDRKNYFKIGYSVPKSQFEELPVFDGYANVGVILQGPMDKHENFTLNTVEMLRHVYPNIKIVLSTWFGEVNEREKERLTEISVVLLENQSCAAEDFGKGRKIGHLNNQLLSSLEGINELTNSEVDYVLKMRTDVRLYKYDFIPYFLNVMSVFPCENFVQKKRLINVALSNTLASVPFHMSDFIWFGTIEDMKKLYSIPTRTDEAIAMIRNMSNSQLEKYTSKFWEHSDTCNMHDIDWLEVSDEEKNVFYNFHAEAYVMHTYAEMNGMCDESLNPLDAYYRFLRDAVIIIDESEAMVYFDKYNYSDNRSLSPMFFKMGHSEWLDLKLHYKHI